MLKQLCAEKDVKLGDLAREIGISQPVMSKLANDKGFPTQELAERIAKRFNLKWEQIFQRLGNVSGTVDSVSVDPEALISALKARGWTASDLADRLEMTRQAISSWSTGTNQAPRWRVAQAATLLGVQPSSLIREIAPTPAPIEPAAPVPPPNRLPGSIRVIPGAISTPMWIVHASRKVELFDLEPMDHKQVPITVFPGDPNDYFLLEVHGQSMADPKRANIQEGSILMMKKALVVRAGQVAAFTVWGGSTLKRIVDRDGKRFGVPEPGPDEPYYEVECPSGETLWHGILVKVMTVRDFEPNGKR